MARSLVSVSVRRVICIAAVSNFLTVGIGLAADQSASESANDAKNLARLNCGAQMTWISEKGAREINLGGNGSDAASNLLLDDNTLNCQMPAGRNTFVIALPVISHLDRFAFINEKSDMAGTIQIFVSNYRLGPNDRNWSTVGREVEFGNGRFVNVPLAAVEAKYVKISFNVKKTGLIAGLGLYGRRSLASFADQKERLQEAAATRIAYTSLTSSSQDNLNFNFANLYAKAHVVSVSSGAKDSVRRMIDDDPTTSFDFAAGDPHPTVVVELEVDQRLRRVSAIYDTVPGQLDIYLLNQPPEADTFNKIKPVVTITDHNASGKAAAEFYPRGARYVALRWTPADPKNHSKFRIAEIGAFSDLSLGVFDVQGIPEQLAQNTAVNPPALPTPSVPPVSP